MRKLGKTEAFRALANAPIGEPDVRLDAWLTWKWKFVSGAVEAEWQQHAVPFEFDALNSLNNDQAAVRAVREFCDKEMRGIPIVVEKVRVVSQKPDDACTTLTEEVRQAAAMRRIRETRH